MKNTDEIANQLASALAEFIKAGGTVEQAEKLFSETLRTAGFHKTKDSHTPDNYGVIETYKGGGRG